MTNTAFKTYVSISRLGTEERGAEIRREQRERKRHLDRRAAAVRLASRIITDAEYVALQVATVRERRR